MRVGLIGTGNMATAMARGWGRPVICADPVEGKASALAGELGGEAVSSNLAVAEKADILLLCHKPAQLESVASEIDGRANVIVSVLGGVPLEALRRAYPEAVVVRVMPSTPVELRQGVVLMVSDDQLDPELRAGLRELFSELGTLVELPESQVDAAMALMSCAPAFWALVAEAQIDAGVRRGLSPAQASEMVIETMAGTAALLRHSGGNTLGVRQAVTSPGGSTARGLAALERGGARAAFHDAVDAVLDA